MSRQKIQKKWLNLAVFSSLIVASGWLAWLFDLAMGNVNLESTGLLIWLFSPLGIVLALRIFLGDGWSDCGLPPRFGQNRVWYLFSLFLYPVLAIILLIIGYFFNQFMFTNFSFTQLASLFATVLFSSFVKNTTEEFAWRGYLTPKLQAAGIPDLLNHLLTGLLWSIWHLPYLLFYFSQSQTSETALIFSVLSFLAASLAYGELRLLTGSIWPTVVARTMADSLVNVMIAHGFVVMARGSSTLAAPGQQSVFSIVFFILAGLFLFWARQNQKQTRR